MVLCDACQNIPWNALRGKSLDEEEYQAAYAKLITVAGTRFVWGDSGGRPSRSTNTTSSLGSLQQPPRSKKWTIDIERDYWPFLRAQDEECSLCRFVVDVVRNPSVQPSYHNGFILKNKKFYGDAWKEKSVWMQLLGRFDERPLVRLHVGDEYPEHFTRQSIEPHTTFGKIE